MFKCDEEIEHTRLVCIDLHISSAQSVNVYKL